MVRGELIFYSVEQFKVKVKHQRTNQADLKPESKNIYSKDKKERFLQISAFENGQNSILEPCNKILEKRVQFQLQRTILRCSIAYFFIQISKITSIQCQSIMLICTTNIFVCLSVNGQFQHQKTILRCKKINIFFWMSKTGYNLVLEHHFNVSVLIF